MRQNKAEDGVHKQQGLPEASPSRLWEGDPGNRSRKSNVEQCLGGAHAQRGSLKLRQRQSKRRDEDEDKEQNNFMHGARGAAIQ